MEQQHQSSIAYLITMEVQQCHYFYNQFKTKLWGGQRLSEFGYQLDNDTTGECWCVSAHPNGTSEIINGPYQGQTLDRIWSEHRELFGDFPSKDFPLLTKIVDARESLSIHVHPDNSYAYEHENGQYGKSECGIL
ncbi:mannose-6-phosphate isomerase [Staphylococcus aureus]|uniref:Mannose-6-phosphate isomerase n=1 Tax=Staphylococcus aureus TaxID=1280 RepID=A0A380EN32_STAAU|nr:mannose-6-phosphate isomerase [Staphylococcus aureus]